MSRSVDLAEAVAAQLNSVPYEWPQPDPENAINPAAHLITDYATAKACVIPQIKRTDSDELRILVAPPPDSRRESIRDRCGRKWKYALNVAVVQRIDETDADLVQPMTLDRIKALMGFSEAIADFIDDNRILTSPVATCTDITQVTYNQNQLKDSHIFLGTTVPIYELNV